MYKGWMMVAVVVALFAVLPAKAQWETGDDNLRVRAGVFFPQKAETRDKADKAWFTAGVEYGWLRVESPGIDAKLTLSADFMGSKTMHNVPVQVNLTSTVDRFNWSVGAGIGFAKNVAGDAKTGMTYSVSLSATLGNTTVPLELGVVWRGMTNVSNQLDGASVYLQLRF